MNNIMPENQIIMPINLDKYIAFTTDDNKEMLKITSDGFYVRGEKIPQDINEAKIVYDTFTAWLQSISAIKRK